MKAIRFIAALALLLPSHVGTVAASERGSAFVPITPSVLF